MWIHFWKWSARVVTSCFDILQSINQSSYLYHMGSTSASHLQCIQHLEKVDL